MKDLLLLSSIPMERIRNFSIIAHIDHGKSTMADRLMETCGAMDPRQKKDQMLDSMDIERERGITIKAQTVCLLYTAKDGLTYKLNLVDTPGHVDFSYEVSRSLAACEGSLLVIDASQGIEAQTLATVYQAIDHQHEVIIALNKIDLPAARPEAVKQQIEEVIGLDASQSLEVSAKKGQGIEEVLEAIVHRLPAPQGSSTNPLQALLVDSWYDPYLGIITLIRVTQGTVRAKMRIRMMSTGNVHIIEHVGVFTPKPQHIEELRSGDIGYVIANIKHASHCKVGDTITSDTHPTDAPLPGFHPSVPVVFCSIFPEDAAEFDHLRDSLEKLQLNDASFSFDMDSSSALGFGFRCGFLGLLHLEIIQERLEREFNLDLIITAPSVSYKVHLTNGQCLDLHNPASLPDPVSIQFMEEPWIEAKIFVPEEYIGGILSLLSERRGIQEDFHYVGGNRAFMKYLFPLNEVAFDFYNALKSASRGYASFDYRLVGYERGDLVKLSILLNGEPVDALSSIIPKSRASSHGRLICEKLKELIPRQLFPIAIQAAIGGKVIARETVSALRKNVTAKCYGGDISRKRKLLEKQKEGKKRMRQFGNIDVPKNIFVDVLKIQKNI